MELLQQETATPQLPYKLDLYDEFIRWYAMPIEAKKKTKIITQGNFADHYKISTNTPTAWKRRPDFVASVRALRKEWGFDRTGDVLDGIYKSATRGNDKSQKLWLQYFEDFEEKSQQTNVQKVEIGVNDIRFLIDQLPEPMKSQHYANLRQLLDDVTAFRNAREAEDSSRADGPADALPGQTDHPAQDVPDTQTDALAPSDPGSVREDMVGEV